MKVDRCQGQVQCQVAARRLWRAAFQDAQNFLPKAVPNAILRIDHEGPPFQPGSLRIIHYPFNYALRITKENHAKHLVQFSKEKIVEVDSDAMHMELEVVDGGYLGVYATSCSYTIAIIDGPVPDSCTVHWSFVYSALSPTHHQLMFNRLKEVVPLSIKGVETYLIANDDYKQ